MKQTSVAYKNSKIKLQRGLLEPTLRSDVLKSPFKAST